MYSGKAVRLNALENGITELVLDLNGSSVNKLNQQTLMELEAVVERLHQPSNAVTGLLIRSAKPAFVVGADVTEFTGKFQQSDSELLTWVQSVHSLFCSIENLPFPTVSMINGLALGGGFELALCTDYRVMADSAKVGFPEVNLGICPGWGGTVRLSRLVSIDTALTWLVTGKPQAANTALQLGVVDRIAPLETCRDSAISLLNDAGSNYQEKRLHKRAPVVKNTSWDNDFSAFVDSYSSKLDPNYPAATEIINTVKSHVSLPFEQALDTEAQAFVRLAKGDTAQALVGLFINEQQMKKAAKDWMKQAKPVAKGAVLGAGIMGGGVAYQSAVSGVPIVMKDIREDALTLGCDTAAHLLDKLVKKGRLAVQDKQHILDSITPTLHYEGFRDVDVVVEAVVENAQVKTSVLADVEAYMAPDAVLASNTSTISIDWLAQGLKRPEQFCGMHFFNPVHLMPLVEVIRGRHTNDQTIARTVAYAAAMGKLPIVVNDCPGFLVNRVLFPYFNGFNRLLAQGVDFERIDRVMEAFGWPMGPAYLADVIGLDTMVHADQVLQKGFPDRMTHDGEPVIEALLASGALGQKNGRGFYEYESGAGGGRNKTASSAAQLIINERLQASDEVSDEEIVDRLMIPLCTESIRCLEDGIVTSAAEVDMGLIAGLGFPRFRGGALRYVDSIGLQAFAKKIEKYHQHGALYHVTNGLRKSIDSGSTYY